MKKVIFIVEDKKSPNLQKVSAAIKAGAKSFKTKNVDKIVYSLSINSPFEN